MSSHLGMDSPDHRILVTVEQQPFRLETTLGPLAKPGDPTGKVDGSGHWKAMHTRLGPATVRVHSPDPQTVQLSAWGSGSEMAVQEAQGWLGLNDTSHLLDTSAHPLVHRLAKQHVGMRAGRFGQISERMVRVILGQKVVAAEAGRSYRRLTYKLSAAAPGPQELRLPITSEELATLPYYEWHTVGVEQKRAKAVSNTMKYAGRLDALLSGSVQDAMAFMEKLPGIGPWTSAGVASHAFGDPDIVQTGDYNLPHMVSWALAGERRGTDQRMLELLEPFTGQRGRVVRLLKMSYSTPPRRGPKFAFRNVENH